MLKIGIYRRLSIGAMDVQVIHEDLLWLRGRKLRLTSISVIGDNESEILKMLRNETASV